MLFTLELKVEDESEMVTAEVMSAENSEEGDAVTEEDATDEDRLVWETLV